MPRFLFYLVPFPALSLSKLQFPISLTLVAVSSLFLPCHCPCFIPVPTSSPSPSHVPISTCPLSLPVRPAACPGSCPRGPQVPVAGTELRGPGRTRARECPPCPAPPPGPLGGAAEPEQDRAGRGRGGGRTLDLGNRVSKIGIFSKKAEMLPEPGEGALRQQENACWRERDREHGYRHTHTYRIIIK